MKEQKDDILVMLNGPSLYKAVHAEDATVRETHLRTVLSLLARDLGGWLRWAKEQMPGDTWAVIIHRPIEPKGGKANADSDTEP